MSVMRVKSLPFLVAFCLLCVVFSFTSFVSLSDLFQLFFIPHVSSFPGSSFAYLALLLCSFSDCLNLPICVIYLFLRDLGFGSLWFLEPFNMFILLRKVHNLVTCPGSIHVKSCMNSPDA